MNTTKIILTACFAGGLLLGSTGCPSKPSGEPAKPQAKAEASAQNAANQNKIVLDEQDKAELNGQMFVAAQKGIFVHIPVLVQMGADVNAKDNEGKTALDLVAGKSDMTEILEKKCAEARKNQKDWEAQRAQEAQKKQLVAAAALAGDVAQIQSLIAQGVNSGRALSTVLVYGESKTILALIEAGVDVNSPLAETGATPLMLAAELGNPEVVQAMIQAGADVNAQAKFGWTPLRGAVAAAARNFPPEKKEKKLRIVQALIQAGANVNAKDSEDGKTVLMAASRGGMADVVRALIEAKADVNAKDNDGKTALMAASRGGKADVVRALIEAGADVNAKDSEGKTALMAASRGGKADVVRALIEAKADVKAKDKDGKTALDAAKWDEIKELLKAAGAK